MDLRSDKAVKKEYVDHAIKLPEARALSGPHVSLSQMKWQLVEVKSIFFKPRGPNLYSKTHFLSTNWKDMG